MSVKITVNGGEKTIAETVEDKISVTDLIIPDSPPSTEQIRPAAAGFIADANQTRASLLAGKTSFVGSVQASDGWYNVMSARHGGGYGDGTKVGFYLATNMSTSAVNLLWNNQMTTGTWQGERTIVDSSNYRSQISEATTSASGLMSTSDKSKLDGINQTWLKNTIGTASTSTNGLMSTSDKSKLDGINQSWLKSTIGVGSTSTNGLMSTSDKSKIDTYLSDTGWKEFTAAGGNFQGNFESYSSAQTVKLRKIGKQVFLIGAVKKITGAQPAVTADTYVGMTLPSGYRPVVNSCYLVQGSGMNRCAINIYSNGNMYFQRYGSSSSVEIPVGAWIAFGCLTWLTD